MSSRYSARRASKREKNGKSGIHKPRRNFHFNHFLVLFIGDELALLPETNSITFHSEKSTSNWNLIRNSIERRVRGSERAVSQESLTLHELIFLLNVSRVKNIEYFREIIRRWFCHCYWEFLYPSTQLAFKASLRLLHVGESTWCGKFTYNMSLNQWTRINFYSISSKQKEAYNVYNEYGPVDKSTKRNGISSSLYHHIPIFNGYIVIDSIHNSVLPTRSKPSVSQSSCICIIYLQH